MAEPASSEGLSAYELQRLEQIRKNKEELARLGLAEGVVPKKPKATNKRNAAASVGNLFELLAMEEQTRNQAFVSALQTQSLSRPLQGRALRCVSLPLRHLHCTPEVHIGPFRRSRRTLRCEPRPV